MTDKGALRAPAVLLAAALCISCAGISYRPAPDAQTAAALSSPAALFPATSFAVFSDPHLYDASLGISGKAFEECAAEDGRLLIESEEILREAVRRVRDLHVQFLLVPGDLTKDGERQDHELFVKYLEELRESGVPAYVVPGNHDILNPRAFSYSASGTKHVENVSPGEFAELYRDFGYGAALFRDTDSLSYVAQPVPGLWLLALDACDYRHNPGRRAAESGGRLGAATVPLIREVLSRAAREKIPVVAMMHHGAVEHFKGQEKYYGDYLVKDWREVSGLLAAYHVRTVFSGHFHAQDVTVKRWDDGRFLYDVETGSLVTDPDPVRHVEIDAEQQMQIQSSFITELPSFAACGRDFRSFSRQSLREAIARIAARLLTACYLPADEAALLSCQISEAFAAHFEGDEKFTRAEKLKKKGLSFMGGLVVAARGDLIEGMWDDLEPADNDITIDLSTGAWRR